VSSVVLGTLAVSAQDVHFEARKHRTSYNGPGRDVPEPDDLHSIQIAYFGPANPDHLEGGDAWLAAELAIEDANAAGGYRGLPFRLVPVWSENPWGTGVARLARLVYSEPIWAVIGSIDGASTHLVEQVVAKARIPLVNPFSTDKTIHLANVPWMFSCVPGDHQMVGTMASALSENESWALVSTTDHDSRVFVAELTNMLSRNGSGPSAKFSLNASDGAQDIVDRLLSTRAPAIVIVARPLVTAALVEHLRAAGYSGSIFGGPSMGRRRFVEAVGTAGEDVVFPLTGNALSEKFSVRYQKRYGRTADYTSFHAYDAVRLVADAVKRGGLNRARIRDAIAELSPWTGESGTIQWDPLGQNDRSVRLGTIKKGRVVPASVSSH
jgi:branched-chain amino acid transport system substrate-binding protein